MSLGFPTSPSEVDAAWFTEAMRSTDMIGDGVEVTAFEAEPIGIGVGILGLLWRISLDYRGDSGPGTAVLKLPHTGAQSREIADAFRFYEREVGFYEQGAPRSPVRTPVRYASAFDVTSGDFVLLMEDVGDRRCYDQMAGCPPEEAARDLGVLAGHHAAWWESPDLDSLSWIVRMADPPNPQSLVPALRQSWPIIESQFGHLLRGPMFEAAKRMPDAVPALLERLGEAPATLLHGDHRLDNLFFSDDEGPDGVVMLDWQITGAGRAPYDVAYFLSQSLVPEERKGVEYDLVKRYHRALVDNGVSGYSFEDCWEDYRLATLFVCCYPLNAGAVNLVNDRAVELFSTMLDRSVSAILDLDALDLLPA